MAIKMKGYLNYKSTFDILCEELFEGDYEQAEKWWYGTKIEGLDRMYPHDLASNHHGRTVLIAWAEGYLQAKRDM